MTLLRKTSEESFSPGDIVVESLRSLKKEKVHARDIVISTYSTEGNEIIVEGQLIDNRLIETYHHSGENRSPDTVHHLVIRMLIDRDFHIREIEAEMPRTPHVDCRETAESLQVLKGMKIARGFTMKIKELFSNGKGCSHLSELIIAMAPAAIQGFWTAYSGNPLPKESKSSMKTFLKNTCWVWRSDGPLMKSLES